MPSLVIQLAPRSTSSAPCLESPQTREQILQEIFNRRRIVRELETDHISWSLVEPKGPSRPTLNTRGKSRHIRLKLQALCSPGASIFGGKHRLFHATLDTRIVRDLKRPNSWKIYGLAVDDVSKTAHYVRVQLKTQESNSQLSKVAKLLDSISAKRYLALDGVRPFGMGGDCGAPGNHASTRIFQITHCAKATPSLRRVNVEFEILTDGVWKRLDMQVERVTFAIYKSASRSNILLSNGPEEIHFTDDPYLRFARMTLKFGGRAERTYIDIEHQGEDKLCEVVRAKRASMVYIPAARVRTSESKYCGMSNPPIKTMARLVFRDRDSISMPWRGSGASLAAVAEAEKVASLIRKTTRVAAQNPLGIKSAVADHDIFTMPLKGVVAEKGYTVTNVEDGHTFQADIREKFKGCRVYAVPSLRNENGIEGITLVSHSNDGEAILRQHIDNPITLITSISLRGFGVPCNSTLIRAKDGNRSIGRGLIRYSFTYGEDDAAILVGKLVQLFTSIEATRVDDLTEAIIKKHAERAGIAPSSRSPTPGHARTMSDSSVVSGYSVLSNTSEPENTAMVDDEQKDWDIYDTPSEVGSEQSEEGQELPAAELAVGRLFRVKRDYTPRLPREVPVTKGDVVEVDFKNRQWCFVKLVDGTGGWVPTGCLDLNDV